MQTIPLQAKKLYELKNTDSNCYVPISMIVEFTLLKIKHKNSSINLMPLSEFLIPQINEENQEDYKLQGFKNNLSEDTLFALCSEILKAYDIELFRIVNKKMKMKINHLAAIPNSEDDNDQILYQRGYNVVSSFDVYYNDEKIGNYGSYLFGEQRVYCQKNNDDEIVPYGEGESYFIDENPELLKSLLKKQKDESRGYLYFERNCWLEHFFDFSDNTSMVCCSKALQTKIEYVHGSIADGFNLAKEEFYEMALLNKRKNENRLAG